jgi:hypothetical protein
LCEEHKSEILWNETRKRRNKKWESTAAITSPRMRLNMMLMTRTEKYQDVKTRTLEKRLADDSKFMSKLDGGNAAFWLA